MSPQHRSRRIYNFNPRSPYGERLHSRHPTPQHPLFQSTLPLRGATRLGQMQYALTRFQSTLPLRGATYHPDVFRMAAFISIHAPLTGSDKPPFLFVITTSKFQSTLPLRGATVRAKMDAYRRKFQSTLPLRGATGAGIDRKWPYKFQSTLPLRGATIPQGNQKFFPRISIHAPLTGSDLFRPFCQGFSCISIHAPLTGSDCRSPSKREQAAEFQSTLPLRGATWRRYKNKDCWGDFNPRSPYGERRVVTPHHRCLRLDFNPRSPYGERPTRLRFSVVADGFQSTLPLRGATQC